MAQRRPTRVRCPGDGEDAGVTTIHRTSASPTDVLHAVRELAPAIAGRAAEIEAARRMPGDLLDDLKAAGCFRMLRPPSHGGMGAGFPTAMRVWEALGRADASVGWTVMIGAASWVDLASLSAPTFDDLFASAPDAITAGAISPSGSIVATDGGYRVDGRWGFVSGCEHADWLFGNCIDGSVDGEPQMRITVFRPDEVVIEDTWNVLGMRGTGSHHVHVDGLFVPAERTFGLMGDSRCIDMPITRTPPPQLISMAVASVAIGVANGALDDIVGIAADKVPLLDHASLGANPLFQHDLAVADTELRAARALLYDAADEMWTTAEQRSPFTPEQRARIRAAAVWVTARAVAVVDAAYHAGGSSSLYVDSPLQRRLRDIHALTQHFIIKRDTFRNAGAILAGRDVDVPIF